MTTNTPEAAKLAEALRNVVSWAQQKCPCENETPDPCPLCDATVAQGRCKAVDSTFPPRILEEIRSALSAFDTAQSGALVAEPVAWQFQHVAEKWNDDLWHYCAKDIFERLSSDQNYRTRELYTTPPTPHATTDAAQGGCPTCGATSARDNGPAEQQAASEGVK